MQRRGVRRGCAHRGLHVSTRSKRRSVSADLLKAFDDTRPERHRLIRWWCISSARAGLIRTIVTAHQPVARWLAPTEIFAVLSWSRSLSDDLAFRRKKRVHTSQGRGGLSVARQLEVKSSHVMSCHPHPPRLAPAGAREWVCTYPLQLPQESHLALAQVSRVLGEFSIQEKGNFYTTISYVSVSCRCS